MITDKENAYLFMQSYIEFSLLLSDYTEVCCDNRKVVGFLFGLLGKKKLSKEEKKKKIVVALYNRQIRQNQK